MTYGEGAHGVPKGLGGQAQPSADAGFLGFKNVRMFSTGRSSQ